MLRMLLGGRLKGIGIFLRRVLISLSCCSGAIGGCGVMNER